MTAPSTVPSPEVRDRSEAAEPLQLVALPVQPSLVARPVVLVLDRRTDEPVRRVPFAEARAALQQLGRS